MKPPNERVELAVAEGMRLIGVALREKRKDALSGFMRAAFESGLLTTKAEADYCVKRLLKEMGRLRKERQPKKITSLRQATMIGTRADYRG